MREAEVDEEIDDTCGNQDDEDVDDSDEAPPVRARPQDTIVSDVQTAPSVVDIKTVNSALLHMYNKQRTPEAKLRLGEQAATPAKVGVERGPTVQNKIVVDNTPSKPAAPTSTDHPSAALTPTPSARAAASASAGAAATDGSRESGAVDGTATPASAASRQQRTRPQRKPESGLGGARTESQSYQARSLACQHACRQHASGACFHGWFPLCVACFDRHRADLPRSNSARVHRTLAHVSTVLCRAKPSGAARFRGSCAG